MRKINKSPNVPVTLQNAPVPTCAADDRESIYKADDVRRQLIEDQHYKCAFCECYITLKYNDVEHYRPKSHYYWLGHDWENLLYSCPCCNRSYKKVEFPLAVGSVKANTPSDDIALEYPLIINPADVEPFFHIKFDKYIAKGVSPEGCKIIKIFHLNDNIDRPELIDNRKQLYELYKIEIDKIKFAEQMLLNPDLQQTVKDEANKIIALSNKSIDNLKSVSKPFSGMLIAQI